MDTPVGAAGDGLLQLGRGLRAPAGPEATREPEGSQFLAAAFDLRRRVTAGDPRLRPLYCVGGRDRRESAIVRFRLRQFASTPGIPVALRQITFGRIIAGGPGGQNGNPGPNRPGLARWRSIARVRKEIMRIKTRWIQASIVTAGLVVGVGVLLAQDNMRPSSYAPVDIHETFATIMNRMSAAKADIMKRQLALLEERYDLSNNPAPGVTMSRSKPIQQGVRVKLAAGVTWDQLVKLTPDQIKARDIFPAGFLPLPHPNHPEGGMVFPKFEINEMNKQENRDLTRFDLDFDIPDQFLPEFPPPIYLTTRPDLGDVSQDKLVPLDNYTRFSTASSTPSRSKASACFSRRFRNSSLIRPRIAAALVPAAV